MSRVRAPSATLNRQRNLTVFILIRILRVLKSQWVVADKSRVKNSPTILIILIPFLLLEVLEIGFEIFNLFDYKHISANT